MTKTEPRFGFFATARRSIGIKPRHFGQVTTRQNAIHELKRASIVMRAESYRRRVITTNKFRKLTAQFSWLSNLAEISIRGLPVVICHYAMRVWNRSHHGAWHLYGHSHGNLPDTPTSLSMDVGVDTHDFRPWHFDEINLLMIEKAKGLSELRRTDPLNIQ